MPSLHDEATKHVECNQGRLKGRLDSGPKQTAVTREAGWKVATESSYEQETRDTNIRDDVEGAGGHVSDVRAQNND